MLEPILEDLFKTSTQDIPESLEKATLVKVWQGDLLFKDSGLPSSHVAYTLVLLKRAMILFSRSVWQVETASKASTTNAAADGVGKSSFATDVSPDSGNNNTRNESEQKRVASARLLSDSEVPSSCTSNSEDQSQEVNLRRTVSLNDPVSVRSQLSDLPIGPKSKDGTSVIEGNCSLSGRDARHVYKELVREMTLEGGWGVCAHACVLGGVLGALGGYNRLPPDWLKQLGSSNQRYLNAKVNLLLDMFGLP